MPINNLTEIIGLVVAVFGLLGLLARYVFIPLKKFTKKLRSNSREILDSLPVLFAMARQWPLLPEGGSLVEVIKELDERTIFKRFWIQSIVDGLNLPAFETNLNGEVVWVSLEWSKLTGLSPDQTYGEGWFSGIAEKDRDRTRREWRDCVEDRRLFDLKFHLEGRKGNTTPVRCRGHVVKSDEDFLGFIGVMLKEENLSNFS